MNKIDFSKQWTFIKEGCAARTVDLPHDAMFEEERCPDSKSGSGGAFFLGGKYTYEKELQVDPGWCGKTSYLEVEGVYPDGHILLNGKEVGYASYGYNNYFFKLNLAEGRNAITIVADNSDMPNSRWYSGAGLYRPVSLYIGEHTHIIPQGLKVRTIGIEPPEIEVTAKITGSAAKISFEVFDGDKNIAKTECNRKFSSGEYRTKIKLKGAVLWDENAPKLYTLKAVLTGDNGAQDISEMTFGIRTVDWDASGLYVNGNRVLLKGGCIHHDNGVLGAKSYYKSAYRKIKKMKEAGFNAIRVSHNPAGNDLLKACDELGMYVMDEAWDMWYKPKNAHDYAMRFDKYYKQDLAAMIDRDYSHPSVIMYSIGNEVSEPAEEKGIALAEELVDCKLIG